VAGEHNFTECYNAYQRLLLTSGMATQEKAKPQLMEKADRSAEIGD
jgi:hypothetical protein